MKIAAAIYLILIILAFAVAVFVPLTIQRSSSNALSIWGGIASPGPLSAAHAFLASQCEVCHTPGRGIEATSCLTCHAKDIVNLRERPSAAFHASINDCRGCHTEHQDGLRPIKMDHNVLVRIGLNSSAGGSAVGDGTHPLSCVACHSDRDVHQTFFGRACGACHGTEAWTIAGYVHPPPTSTACAQCHPPPARHYSGHFFGMGMMAGGARVEQCYLCHRTTSWRDRKAAGSFGSH
jgi:hypothetical protein